MPLRLTVGAHATPIRGYRHAISLEITHDRSRPDLRITGRSQHEDFVVTKDLDALSPRLLRWCAEGAAVPEVRIEVARGADDEGGDPVGTFEFVLIDVIVTSVLTSCEADAGLLETVALDYGSIRWVSLGEEPVSTDWDVHRRRR